MNNSSATMTRRPVAPPNSALNPYSGVWGKTQITHLLRRTMFGAKKSDVDYFLSKSMTQTVDELLNTNVNTAPAPPLNSYSYPNCPSDNIDPKINFGETWVNSTREPGGIIDQLRTLSTKAWWIGLMINQERSILEKMVLFWHNHIPIASSEVNDARNQYSYLALLRKYAIGNFKSLIKDITINPGMLDYLNGDANIAGNPDENYARELQELFCVGKGPDSKYTEDDVKEAAKVLTGWRYRNTDNPPYGYNLANNHDKTDKQFSSFYKNTIIKGSNDANKELDDLLNMIFSTDEVAKFIVRKVYTFFVYYDITPQIETDIITPLADIFRSNNYNILPVLDKLFKSEHFYDIENKSCLIRPGIDFIVGFCRESELVFPTNAQLESQYQAWLILSNRASGFQHSPLDPPNVAGWPAYYQSPQYHELWVNAITIQARKNAQIELISLGNPGLGIAINIVIQDPNDSSKTILKNYGYLKIDTIGIAKRFSKPSDPNVLIQDFLDLYFGYEVSATTKANAKKTFLLKNQVSDSAWTDAWNKFLADETNAANKKDVEDRLKNLFSYSFSIPEYQLC